MIKKGELKEVLNFIKMNKDKIKEISYNKGVIEITKPGDTWKTFASSKEYFVTITFEE